MKKILLILISALLILFTLAGCDGKVSNKKLQKMLKASSEFSDLIPDSAKVMAENEIGNGKKAVLFSAKKSAGESASYYIGTTDAKSKYIYALRFSYEPLKLITHEISQNRPESMNTTLYRKIVDCFSSYGDNYLTDEENAITFLRDITGDNGVIPTQIAQDIITNHIKENSIYNEEDELWVVFEDNNAVPLCYAIKTKTSYGPDDDSETMWVAYLLSGEKVGTYATKAELYEDITGEYTDFGDEIVTKGTIRLAVVANKEPFVYSMGGTPSGADIDIADAIAKELKMDLEVTVMSKETAISSTTNGAYDMAMGGFTTAIADDDITVTDNYYGDYVIVLGDDDNLNAKICSALAKIKSNGTAREIMEKHNVHKLPKEEPAPEVKEDPKEDKKEEPKKEEPKKEEPKKEEPQKDEPKKDESEKEDSKQESPSSTKDNVPSTILYRVRKSADDSKSQLGAFSSLENAKKEADAHKDEGYKVYDMNGKLIYTP